MNGATRFPLSPSIDQRTYSQGNGLGDTAGKEDPVELDSSLEMQTLLVVVEYVVAKAQVEHARPQERGYLG